MYYVYHLEFAVVKHATRLSCIQLTLPSGIPWCGARPRRPAEFEVSRFLVVMCAGPAYASSIAARGMNHVHVGMHAKPHRLRTS